MKEKQHTPKQTEATGGPGLPDSSIPDVTENKSVNISSGPYAETLPVAGMSVAEIRRRYSGQFDIAAGSQAIVDGKPSPEETILKAGESLMFVKHAGEKGGDHPKIVLEGEQAKFDSGPSEVSMAIKDLARRMGPPLSTGDMVLPTGIKSVISRGNCTILVLEIPPHIAYLSWIAEDSPEPYGSGTEYRKVRISLPYLIIMSPFINNSLVLSDECFFRTESLKGMDDDLSYPALLNCSKYPDHVVNKPLSWICTQHIKLSRSYRNSANSAVRFREGMAGVRSCLLDTSFNLSSEHNEGNSWYGASKGIDPRIATIRAWEESTQKDPMFVLDVPWIKTGFSLKGMADRMFNRMGITSGFASTSTDVALLMAAGV